MSCKWIFTCGVFGNDNCVCYEYIPEPLVRLPFSAFACVKSNQKKCMGWYSCLEYSNVGDIADIFQN